MEDYNPGPLDRSILFDQENHISESIWNGMEYGPLRCIPTSLQNAIWKLNERQVENVRRTGLHHLAKIENIRIDHALITGLVERWRPETNTFHFNGGEATVTLEDVAYIYGLPIDGKAVTGTTFSSMVALAKMCDELLGNVPDPEEDCDGQQIKFTWFYNKFTPPPERMCQETEDMYTRAYLFVLVAGQIYSNSSGGRGAAFILGLFRTFEKFAWGPACLANLYRTLSKASSKSKNRKTGKIAKAKPTKSNEFFKTVTGPLQLLQIWAYSRMSIGRMIRREDSNTKFEFPLCKMWAKRLKSHKVLTTISEVRNQLDSQTVDSFNWQPYVVNFDNLAEYVDKEDRALFGSNTVLLFFWIAERHNANRIMRQFGLLQIVPPYFYRPYDRGDRVFNVTIDYSKLADMIEVWNKRHCDVVNGEEATGPQHTDEYLQWYRGITRLRVGQPFGEDVPDNPVYSKGSTSNRLEMRSPSNYERTWMQEFLNHCIASCDVIEGQSKSALEKFVHKIRKKMRHFNNACASGFANFNMEECIRSSSDEDSTKKNKDRKRARKEKVFDPALEDLEVICLDSPSDSPHYTSLAFTSTPTDFPPIQQIFQTHSHSVFHPQVNVHTPQSGISSLILHMKANSIKKKVPVRLSPYNVQLFGPSSPNLSLTQLEEQILDSFWRKYYTKKEWIAEWCTPIRPDTLWKTLNLEWMDTFTMDYWFECLQEEVQSTCIFSVHVSVCFGGPNLQSFDNVFGSKGARIQEIITHQTIVFPCWSNKHFFLLVGYVEGRKWEYYNSMMAQTENLDFISRFVPFLISNFAKFGWYDPSIWPIQEMLCPQQDNTCDCGIFVMAFADCLLKCRPLTFTNADMWYYRQKIVVDIYARQWKLNGYKVPESEENSFL